MLGSYLYWITTAALVLCLFMSLLRRQTVKHLAEARKKLLDERQEREQMRAELVHVRNSAEKDLAAAKKQASDAKAARTEIDAEKGKLLADVDALRVELDGLRASLADRTASEESAKKRTAELEERLTAGQTGVAAVEIKLGELTRELQGALVQVEALQKKLEAEARLRKSAEDERSAVKATVTTLESKQREAERAKVALEEAQAQALAAVREASSSLEAELASTKERLAKAEEELATERSKVQTPPSQTPAAAGGDLLAALEADPYLNRGQKETIRMTYNQFTAKRRSS